MALALIVMLTFCGGCQCSKGASASEWGHSDEPARSLGQRFLRDYVDHNGRVVRRDEGGDVVSEGQAYGMLIAVAVKDESTFRRVWSWTKANLMTANGLLAWRWDQGFIQDTNSASDADLDAARALLLAGKQFDAAELTSDGRELARSAMEHEAMPVTPAMFVARSASDGGPSPVDGVVLLAGNWAETPPHEVNPSYFSPRAEQMILASTGDQRWNALTSTHRAVLAELLTKSALPPDWVDIQPDSIAAVGHQGREPIQFGLDAARVPIRLAESCAPEDRLLAASMQATLDRPASPVGIRHLDGSPAVEWKHPIALVASAASDQAAGDSVDAQRRLAAAADLESHYPSYYGAAWVALGYLMLDSSLLGSCA